MSSRKTDPAKIVGRMMQANRHAGPHPEPGPPDDFSGAIVQRMVQKGILAPAEPEPLPRHEIEQELRRHNEQFEAAREAQRQAEQEAERAREPIVDVVRSALVGTAEGTSSAPAAVALNDIAGLIRGAMSGATINGEVIAGRNE